MPVGMFVAAGPVADCTQAHRRVEGIELPADKGYNDNTGVELLEKRRISPVIPPRKGQKYPREYDKNLYQTSRERKEKMKGKILAFNKSTGEGSISGEDSNRYTFPAEEWKESGRPVRGSSVDFVGVDGKATEIYTAPSFMTFEKKNKILAALLAFFLGCFGIYKFYMGYATQGFIMLAVSVVGYIVFFIPTLIIGVIDFIEFIIYITKSDADFDEIYAQGHRPWF